MYVTSIFARSDGEVWEGLCVQRDGIASCDNRQAACSSSIFLKCGTWADIAFSSCDVFEIPRYKTSLGYSEEP